MHSRYHFERVYFYNAFDHARSTDTYYTGLYNSSGFWRLGTNPQNSAWASPLPAHGASPKPAWYGMLDFKTQLGGHVFYKALAETPTAFVYLLAKPDGSEPCLLFWSPEDTDDSNINEDIWINQTVSWDSLLPAEYMIASGTARMFASGPSPAPSYYAATSESCQQATIHRIRRNPAVLPLIACEKKPEFRHKSTAASPVKSFQVRPNPGSDHFYIECNSETGIQCRIYAASGAVMHEHTATGMDGDSVFRIETASWPKGFYFICVTGPSGTIQQIWEKW
jgi:hypothetical protein